MADHHNTAKQFFLEGRANLFFKPVAYEVTHRLKSVNDLKSFIDKYDLFIFDRDRTLQKYHGLERELIFEDTLQLVSSKSELNSNSNLEEVSRISKLYSGLMPVSTVVKLKNGGDHPYLLRFINDELFVWKYDVKSHVLTDKTSDFCRDNKLLYEVSYKFKKPHPLTIMSVIDINVQLERISDNPKVLMVGDRFWTDVFVGNLAGIDVARVKPYKYFSDWSKGSLIISGLLDSLFGTLLSRQADSVYSSK